MFERLRELLTARPVKLSISIVMLVTSVMFVADFVKLRGDPGESEREARKAITESLAIQLTLLASESDLEGIKLSVLQFVTRNNSVHSAALVDAAGEAMAQYGDEAALGSVAARSTLTHISIPIFNGNERWGEVKVVFSASQVRWQEIRYFVFIFVASFLVCLLFLRKILVQLDPGQVVPSRVSSAFNMFTESVIILDNQMRILVVNEAAASVAGKTSDGLLGKRLDDWPWITESDWQAPWTTALHTGLNVSDQPLTLETGGTQRILMASCTVVGDDSANNRGVLVTLHDRTALVAKNRKLALALEQVNEAQAEISEKNRELEALATLDPLTGLFNRRALLQRSERDFTRVQADNTPLCCIMTDIDHFKRVNDTFGHAVGDEIIKAVANTLSANTTEIDTVGRYGGEEFVVVLPGRSAQEALRLAEQMRIEVTRIVDKVSADVDSLSSSFGIAECVPEINNITDLIERADQALYFAKQSGRNRVIVYSENVVQLKSEVEADTTIPLTQDESATRVVELEAIVDAHSRDLEHIREFDTLTGIPTRSLFLQRVDTEIDRATRNSTRIGLLSLEIRNLERIVSTFGYDATDELVVEFVQRLQAVVRTSDLASNIEDDHSMSRITSNEYGVLIPDLENSSHAMPVLTRLRKILSEAFVIDGQKIYLGANIGIALYPRSGENASTLLEAASQARVEAAGQSDKISHSFASSSLDQESRDYIELESALHDALGNNQLAVHYQPKLDLASRQICGVEALLRWYHPAKGLVPPDQFIRIAEANGLIHEITEFVFETALSQLHEWHAAGWSNLKLSINVSALQLRELDLALKVLGAIRAAGVPASHVELEITETSMIESPQRARVVLGQLRDAGVSVSMDDFGTGYTSLALLADLPLDCVKIDRSFVNAMATSERSRAIVESIIIMAHALKLWVVGEGVETNEQLATLASLRCNEVQGYLISKPLPADDLSAYLEQIQASGTKARRA